MPEILVIALAIILLFGAKKLPEFARAIGEAIKEFKKAMKDVQEEIKIPETTSPNTISPAANQVPRQAAQAAEAEKKETSGTPAA